MQPFDGKSALITGGSSGIGLALGKALAGQGAHVTILARDPHKLEAACHAITAARKRADQRVTILAADVADAGALHAALAPHLQHFGAPDFLFNSAGITHPGLFEEMPLEISRANMEINFFGTLYACREVIPAMLERGSGHIVNIASLVGFHGLYGYSAYAPSKFAVRGLSDCLRYELQPRGIRVSVVYPADTQTPQLEYENRFKPPVLKALVESNSNAASAEEVAARTLRGVQRGKYMILPSMDSKIWFLAYSLLPGHALYWLVDRLMDSARRKAAKNLNRH